MAYFDGIQVGDRIWFYGFGWGEVINILDNETYSIDCRVTSPLFLRDFQIDHKGMTEGCIHQVAFWDEVKITPPPRPKKKEKKRVECWASVCPASWHGSSVTVENNSFFFCANESDAKCTNQTRPVAKVQIEWEE